MTPEETRQLLERDPDFINLPRFDNSLRKLLERHPDVVPDKLTAQALMLEDEASVEREYQRVVRKLQRLVGVSRG